MVEEIKASQERIRLAEEVLAEASTVRTVEAGGLEVERKRLEQLIRAAERTRVARANAPR